jgi:hypothetical protein
MGVFMGGAGPKPDASDSEPMDNGGGNEDSGGKDYSALQPLLQDYAADIEAAANELEVDPQEALGEGYEPDEGVIEQLESGMEGLDDDFVEGMDPLAGIDSDSARELAQGLQDDGLIQDEDKVAAWIFLVGNHALHSEPDGDEGMNEPGDDDGDEGLPDDLGAD